MTLIEVYTAANLTMQERNKMPQYLDWDDEFWSSSAYEKLYEYFAFEACEMPYGVMKARTECPDEWILARLQGMSHG